MEARLLYKYRALTGAYGLSNVEDIILRNRMRWQSPTSFNDPFDCAPELIFGMDKQERKRFAKEAANKAAKNSNRSDRRKLSANIKSRDIDDVCNNLFSYFREAMKNSAVSCFSLIENNPLMWAHYAASHTGICLAFEEDPSVGFFGLDVRYSEVRDVVDLTKFGTDGPEMLSKAVLTKSTDWSYEKEVRMIEYKRPAGVRYFDRSRLKSVTLGLRISDKDEKSIKELVSRRNVPIEIYRAVVQEKSFSLISVPV